LTADLLSICFDYFSTLFNEIRNYSQFTDVEKVYLTKIDQID
jgi:hypothetical protein